MTHAVEAGRGLPAGLGAGRRDRLSPDPRGSLELSDGTTFEGAASEAKGTNELAAWGAASLCDPGFSLTSCVLVSLSGMGNDGTCLVGLFRGLEELPVKGLGQCLAQSLSVKMRGNNCSQVEVGNAGADLGHPVWEAGARGSPQPIGAHRDVCPRQRPQDA